MLNQRVNKITVRAVAASLIIGGTMLASQGMAADNFRNDPNYRRVMNDIIQQGIKDKMPSYAKYKNCEELMSNVAAITTFVAQSQKGQPVMGTVKQNCLRILSANKSDAQINDIAQIINQSANQPREARVDLVITYLNKHNL